MDLPSEHYGSDKVVGLCTAELKHQLTDFLGLDFSIAPLRRHLRERAVFKESRGVIHSFADSQEVYDAQNATWEGVRFTPRCEADTDAREIADYRGIAEAQDDTPERIAIHISPNALKAVFIPVREILEIHPGTSMMPGERIRDEALNTAYRGLYSSVITRFALERHIYRIDDSTTDEELADRGRVANELYDQLLGQDSSEPIVRINRLAMAAGGAVMLRYLANSMSYMLKSNPEEVGNSLRMYTLGTKTNQPRDEQQATFALAHSLTPLETTRMMRQWFSV